jgi:hypothetical protein
LAELGLEERPAVLALAIDRTSVIVGAIRFRVVAARSATASTLGASPPSAVPYWIDNEWASTVVLHTENDKGARID